MFSFRAGRRYGTLCKGRRQTKLLVHILHYRSHLVYGRMVEVAVLGDDNAVVDVYRVPSLGVVVFHRVCPEPVPRTL